MALLIAVRASDLRLLDFDTFLRTSLCGMANLCRGISKLRRGGNVVRTIATTADWLGSLHSNSSVFFETLKILLWRGRPSFSKFGALGLESVIVSDDIFAVFLALGRDAGHAERELFLLSRKSAMMKRRVQHVHLTRAIKQTCKFSDVILV
jgi:hypothetical protein